MNIAVNNVEEKAVHSWSRISSAGQKALEEALRVFNPMSKDLSDTETQLVAFLQGLREEGYQPTILRSKDVYGYSSCTADTPGQTEESIQHSSGAAMAPNSADALAIPTATPTRMAAPLAGISVSSSTVSPKPVSKGSSTNLLLNSLKQTRSGTSKAPAMAFPANMYPDVYPAVRLSVVLEALVPLKTAAPCLESKYKPGQLGLSPSDHRLHKASSASARTAKVMSGPLDPKGCKHFAKKVPDSSSLAAGLLKGPKGGVLQESNACKASGVLNGRITGSSSQSISGGPPAKASKVKAREVPGGRTEWRESSGPTETTAQKRKRALEPRDTPQKATANAMPAPHKADRAPSAWNLLKFRVIKVDGSSSDDEVRRRAQQILRVNLSPVIRIQPLSHAHSVP